MSQTTAEKTEVYMIEQSADRLANTGAYDGDDIGPEKAKAPHDVRRVVKKSKEERHLVNKQDLLILPLLTGSIFFAYLDRGQIGNARIMGMQTDLNLSAQQYYNCLMMFYIGYMTIELPAGLLLRVASPRWVVGIAVVLFGVFAASMGAVKSYGTLLLLRVFVGFAEGLGYNVYIYLSLWYQPHELALRTAATYAMSPIAGAMSGLIAYGIQKNLNGALGYKSWEWLFIIEGVVTIAFGLLIIVLLPALPDTVAKTGHFLFRNENEQRMISERTRKGQNTEGAKPRYGQILVALKDPKLWLVAHMIGSWGIVTGGFGVFLPTFIKEFGFSALQTQLYSMIPYAFGFVGLIAGATISNHYNVKAAVVLGCNAISATGFVILLSTTNKAALMAALCFVLTGLYPATIVSLAWIMTMNGGYTKRATAIWVMQVFIQSYSIIATQIYTTPPRFLRGHGIVLGFLASGAICTILLWYLMTKANRDRDRRAQEFAERGEVDPDMEKTFEDLCDNHPAWRYSV